MRDLLDLVERYPITAVWLIGCAYAVTLMALLGAQL